MGTSVAAASVLGTLLGLLARKGYGTMALLVSYLWLWITTSLAFFIRLLARKVFRPRREEERYKHGGSTSALARPLVPIAESGKLEEEEEEAPVLQFKFSFQLPDQSINSRGEQGVSAGEDGGVSMATSVSKYRFFPEGDSRGILEAPQAMTLRVQESYVDSDGKVWSSTEELDRELKGRLSSAMLSRQADTNIGAAEELDRELNSRILSVKFPRVVGAAGHEEEEGKDMSLYPYNLSKAYVTEEVELLNVRLPDEADAPADARPFLVPKGGFGGFDSDSDWESRSDGYSVKDLALDFDTDGGFFSERDFEAGVDRTRSLVLDGGVFVESEQKFKPTQLSTLVDSVGGSQDFDGEGMELLENTENRFIEMKLKGLPNSISSSGLRDDVVPKGIIGSRTEELDREIKSRLSLVKQSWQDDSDVGVADELDRELKCRLLSVKSSRRHDSYIEAAVHEEDLENKSLNRWNLARADACEELELLHRRLPYEAIVTARGQLFPVPAGDLSPSSSDSESESRSDGYSVKDLIIDFDSDGLFSEKDFDIDKARSLGLNTEEEDYKEFQQKFKATQLPNSIDSVGVSKDFGGEDPKLQESKKNCTENKLVNLSNSTSSPSPNDDIVYDGDLCAAEHESGQLHQEENDDKKAISDSNYTDEMSSITSHVGLDTEHLVKVQPEGILSEAGQGGIDPCGVEESESSESRGGEGIQMLSSCSLDIESAHCSIKNQNMNNSNLFNPVPSEEAPATPTQKSKTVTSEDTGDVAEAGENSDEVEQGLGSPQASEETQLSETSEELCMEEMEEMESLLEHQDLIEQLRMDLKKARATGLPTILEESETPSPAEGVKPWKPEAQFLREDPMAELHKFYKSYRERMRKFDVVNHQKMYAIGFLQLKEPLNSMGTHKHVIPTIAAIVSHNLWRRKSGADPSEKFIKELQSDLETVYVGQSCLSWEFLRWQYETTRELLGSDPHDSRQYSQVAEEFQQFQVLTQRFLENEPFQGPRVANYAKNRCVLLRRLLQVPVIREDHFKDKAEKRRQGKDAITGEQLEYIMEDSIRIFWEFVKSDKDETSLIMKGLLGAHAELQDPKDLDFLLDIQANLKLKKKKLKDVLKTGNCLVKKFKKPRQGGSNQDELFFSQVDLKLVSRVLKMTRITTDQLVWCHKKLSKITFVDRKLLREPSFLLFPC